MSEVIKGIFVAVASAGVIYGASRVVQHFKGQQPAGSAGSANEPGLIETVWNAVATKTTPPPGTPKTQGRTISGSPKGSYLSQYQYWNPDLPNYSPFNGSGPLRTYAADPTMYNKAPDGGGVLSTAADYAASWLPPSVLDVLGYK